MKKMSFGVMPLAASSDPGVSPLYGRTERGISAGWRAGSLAYGSATGVEDSGAPPAGYGARGRGPSHQDALLGVLPARPKLTPNTPKGHRLFPCVPAW